jgi:twinkle protein
LSNLRLKGIYRVADYLDKIQGIYQHGVETGDSCGWPILGEMYKVKRGQWTVLTGIPNHGKSMWLDNVMVNLAKDHGWKFLVCSPENQPIERHIVSLMEIFSGKKFSKKTGFLSGDQFITNEEIALGTLFLEEHFVFIYPEETDFHIDYILDLAGETHREWKFDGMVIDPYNELEHKRPAAMTETEYISQILTKYRRFQRSHNTHGWMVAHPTKLREVQTIEKDTDAKKLKLYSMPSLYDISGSANWRNKADNGVVVYRDFSTDPQKTIVSVQKIRFRECGKLGQSEFIYNPANNRLTEV